MPRGQAGVGGGVGGGVDTGRGRGRGLRQPQQEVPVVAVLVAEEVAHAAGETAAGGGDAGEHPAVQGREADAHVGGEGAGVGVGEDRSAAFEGDQVGAVSGLGGAVGQTGGDHDGEFALGELFGAQPGVGADVAHVQEVPQLVRAWDDGLEDVAGDVDGCAQRVRVAFDLLLADAGMADAGRVGEEFAGGHGGGRRSGSGVVGELALGEQQQGQPRCGGFGAVGFGEVAFPRQERVGDGDVGQGGGEVRCGLRGGVDRVDQFGVEGELWGADLEVLVDGVQVGAGVQVGDGLGGADAELARGHGGFAVVLEPQDEAGVCERCGVVESVRHRAALSGAVAVNTGNRAAEATVPGGRSHRSTTRGPVSPTSTTATVVSAQAM